MRVGWIKAYRQILDHWLWKGERFSRGQAWMDLLLQAAYADYQTRVGNKLVTVKRGQLPVSQRDLARRWKWARNTVWSFLRVTEREQMLRREVSRELSHGYTILTICNYDRYQGSDKEALSHHLSHERATKEPPLEPHNKKGKKEKNGKDSLSLRKGVGQTRPDSSLNGFISQAVQYLNEKAGTSYKPTMKSTIRHLTARAKEGFTLEDIKAVVDYKTAVWDRDPKMHEYLRPETLFGPKFESYLQAAKKGDDHAPVTHTGVAAALRVRDRILRQAGRGGGGLDPSGHRTEDEEP